MPKMNRAVTGAADMHLRQLGLRMVVLIFIFSVGVEGENGMAAEPVETRTWEEGVLILFFGVVDIHSEGRL